MTYNQYNSQQMKVSIIMQPLLIFFTCLVMLCLVVYFLGHFWMTSILLDVNMYCRFFPIFELLNWVINNPLVLKIKVWRIENFFHVSHMRVGLIPCLVFFKRKQNTWRFYITNTCITFLFTWILNVIFWILTNIW